MECRISFFLFFWVFFDAFAGDFLPSAPVQVVTFSIKERIIHCAAMFFFPFHAVFQATPTRPYTSVTSLNLYRPPLRIGPGDSWPFDPLFESDIEYK